MQDRKNAQTDIESVRSRVVRSQIYTTMISTLYPCKKVFIYIMCGKYFFPLIYFAKKKKNVIIMKNARVFDQNV